MNISLFLNWSRYLIIVFIPFILLFYKGDVSCILIILSIVFLRPAEKQKRLEWSILDCLIIIWCVYFCLSNIKSNNVITSNNLITTTILSTNIYLIIRWHSYSLLRILKKDNTIIICTIFLLSVFYYNHYLLNIASQEASFGNIYYLRHLLRPFGWMINAWGSLLIALIFIILLRNKNVLLFSFLISVGILLTFSRSAYISLLLITLALTALSLRRKDNKYYLYGVLAAILIIAFTFPKELSTTVSFNSNESQELSTNWRMDALVHSTIELPSLPLTGYGATRFSEISEIKSEFDTTKPFTTVAPNILSLLSTETGVIGLIILLGILITKTAYTLTYSHNYTNRLSLLFIAVLVIKEMTQSFLFNFSCLMICIYVILAIGKQKGYMIKSKYLFYPIIITELLTALFIGFRYKTYHRDWENIQNTKTTALNTINDFCTVHPYDPYIKLIACLADKNLNIIERNLTYKYLSDSYPCNGIFKYCYANSEYEQQHFENATKLFADAIVLCPRILYLKEFKDILDTDSILKAELKDYSKKYYSSRVSTSTELAKTGYVFYYFKIPGACDSLRKAITGIPNISTPHYILKDYEKFDLLKSGISAKYIADRSILSPLKEISMSDLLDEYYLSRSKTWYGEDYANYMQKITNNEL